MAENLYERNKIYDEVWADPVTIVAKRYGASGVAIHKVCKRLSVPVPPRGYWARLRSGEKIDKTPLPPHTGIIAMYGKEHGSTIQDDEITEGGKKQSLAFLDDQERQKITDACASIEIKEQLRRPHFLIIEHREEMALRKKRERERKRYDFYGGGLSYSNRQNNVEPDKHVLALRVSSDSIHRAYLLIDAFIRTL